MREILFRGKRTDNGEWVEGDLLRQRNALGYDSAIVYFEDEYILPRHPSVDLETVGQYTGLKDSAGKRIFEGDVIENRDDEGCYTNFVIEWINQEAGFFARYIDKKHGENLLTLGDYKAIGNIHDNPELLEVQ